MLEVEVKFRLDDPDRFVKRVSDRFAVSFGPEKEQTDIFFCHVNRDFSKTDECLRLRYCNNDLKITYKGPKLDKETKTREEIELPLYLFPVRSYGTEKQLALKVMLARLYDWRQLLNRLGFQEAAILKKTRRKTEFEFQGFHFYVTLDHLPELGYFTEFETMASSPEYLEETKRVLLAATASFDLTDSIRESYLELVIRKQDNK